MKRIKQINNLIIKYDNWFKYCVCNGSIVLEDRLTLKQAESFCKRTKDFIFKKENKQ